MKATLQLKVDELMAQKRFLAPELVQEELDIAGIAKLAAFAKLQPGIFVPLADVVIEAQSIENRLPLLCAPNVGYEKADA